MSSASGGRFWPVLLVLLVMLTPLGVDIYLPSMPLMRSDFEGDNAELQLTITLFLFTVGIGQLLVGPLTDRHGRKRWALAGCLLYALGAVLGAFSPTLSLMYTARFLQGMGACVATVVAFSAVRDAFTPQRGAQIYSYLNGSLCIIPALAPALGGVLASLAGWRSTFLFMAVFALLTCVMCARFLPETLPASKRSLGALYQLHRFLPMLTNARFMFFATLAAIGMGAVLIYVTASPVLLVDTLGLSQWQFGLVFGANALINVVSFFGATRLIARLGRVPTFVGGACLIVVSGLMFFISFALWGASVVGFMAPVAVFTAGFSLALGSAVSLALEAFPDRAGSASALFGCFQMSGGAGLAALFSHVPVSAYLVLGGVCAPVIGGLLWLGYIKRVFSCKSQ
ncbi:multidrug effflux MFS transporter [Larsenimonas suaedae]|uniref:Bcr/CflA family efflux transporter n=1 Tax=Larsenimonas suaedae TaxID=1851019 RepID=A0ABU1GYU6_9GAMM|nr:multidrug effflux MFS transporter [Larsenimonas suaedae]MCM2971480.1 multidrug effflux MFS transporter [Larsenimonas suaedae]MDR5896736.1 multidrug effflux MFS transporter [Larsenimonas suaedae]